MIHDKQMFPCDFGGDDRDAGMTLRDYAAVHIMATMAGSIPPGREDSFAKQSVTMADALLATLAEKKETP